MRIPALLLHASFTELSGDLQNQLLRESSPERSARLRVALRKVDAAVRSLAALDRDVWELWRGPESETGSVRVADNHFNRSHNPSSTKRGAA